MHWTNSIFARTWSNEWVCLLTPLLAAGVQSYFYSSFDAPMEDISAACGWNFVAAEEGGRWVLPGGNTRFVYELWQRLKKREDDVPAECRPHFLRGGCRVIDVRPRGERLQVTYYDSSQTLRSVSARFVIMAGSKHIAKHVLYDLEHWDWDKLQAMNQISTSAYLVANILLESPIERDFYDCFLLGDGVHYPMNSEAPRAKSDRHGYAPRRLHARRWSSQCFDPLLAAFIRNGASFAT